MIRRSSAETASARPIVYVPLFETDTGIVVIARTLACDLPYFLRQARKSGGDAQNHGAGRREESNHQA